MAIERPRLDIQGPEGEKLSVELGEGRTTIGRLRDQNDIALEPDPQQLITRRVHCYIEEDAGSWWVVDNGSVNGTYVERDDGFEPVHGRVRLLGGTVVAVVGRLIGDDPAYWKLAFRGSPGIADPAITQPIIGRQHPELPSEAVTACASYDWQESRLYIVRDGRKERIRNLSIQEHKLVRFMARRNQENEGAPVLCAFDDLIEAVWEGEVDHTPGEVHGLVRRLRRRIGGPDVVENERGFGYRLLTCRAERP